jgi:hypothetical protein
MMINFFKQILCVALVAVILLQTIGKTIVLANYEINKEYISKVLCVNKSKPKMHCNGKCHLKKELSKAEKREKLPLNSTIEKVNIQLFSTSTDIFELSALVISTNNDVLFNYSFHQSDKHPSCIFQPPQV